MVSRVHPLTGQKMNGKAANGTPRADLSGMESRPQHHHRARMSIDAARSGTDLDGHWVHADSLDPDSAYSRHVRHTLIKRSRYEGVSNGYYSGICETHSNMLVGVGPQLRMLTGNREFNQLVEREFYAWGEAVQLRRKLWCMSHAKTADGESFAIFQTNPEINHRVQLDILPFEAEQCQTPFIPQGQSGYVDGISYDKYGNVLWYDVLPQHPGSSEWVSGIDPIRVSPRNMAHWFKLKRPGAHRGIPALTSTLPVGASSRRFREATIAAAETAADMSVVLQTRMSPDVEAESVAAMSAVEFQKRMMVAAPMGWEASQMRAEHPNAQYVDFNRTLVSEQARPISMPYNAAACDSSTYSFASGKLDTLCYRAALNVEREDCNDLVMNRIFAEWFREWTILSERRDMPPAHQWDWPAHPVIDAVADATATDTRLKNGTLTLRQAYSDDGKDLEDQLFVMAEDWFGEATEENIAKARKICVLKNTPPHAINHIAEILGVTADATKV